MSMNEALSIPVDVTNPGPGFQILTQAAAGSAGSLHPFLMLARILAPCRHAERQAGSDQQRPFHESPPVSKSMCFVVTQVAGSLTHNLSISLVHRIPIDDVVERTDIVSTLILVLEVVGVLPDVNPKHRLTADG